MKRYNLELIIGLFMVAGMIALAVLAFKVSGLTGLKKGDVYHVTAAFTHIGDLKVRAPVTIAGVSIGRVTKVDLDSKTFKAVITLEINAENDHISTDSTANIFTAGLIGTNYVSIKPGFDETYLEDGDRMENTNQALILQNLIGQLMFTLKNKPDN